MNTIFYFIFCFYYYFDVMLYTQRVKRRLADLIARPQTHKSTRKSWGKKKKTYKYKEKIKEKNCGTCSQNSRTRTADTYEKGKKLIWLNKNAQCSKNCR